jgi:hypothetical protein
LEIGAWSFSLASESARIPSVKIFAVALTNGYRLFTLLAISIGELNLQNCYATKS